MIRPVSDQDWHSVYEILCFYIQNSSANLSWNIPEYEEFVQEQKKLAEDCPYLVSELDGEVIGFGYVHPYLSKDAYQFDGEVTIYFRQGKHYGEPSRMLKELEEISRKNGKVLLTACITAENCPSVSFFKKHGYVQYGYLPQAGLKNGIWHDVLWMAKRLKKTED